MPFLKKWLLPLIPRRTLGIIVWGREPSVFLRTRWQSQPQNLMNRLWSTYEWPVAAVLTQHHPGNITTRGTIEMSPLGDFQLSNGNFLQRTKSTYDEHVAWLANKV